MLSLISTLGGLLVSGLPKLLEHFQNKADQKHELAVIRMQNERDVQMMREGFLAQQKVEEIRTEQVAMQTEAQMTQAALAHDEKVLDRASKWVANYVGTVRPTVTYIFVMELVFINVAYTAYVFMNPNMIQSMDDLIKVSEIIFSDDEMAMLGGIIGFWFGSRQWNKK
jgi:Ni2+-binding GTPase involved in maturation of urease and hydrogenase